MYRRTGLAVPKDDDRRLISNPKDLPYQFHSSAAVRSALALLGCATTSNSSAVPASIEPEKVSKQTHRSEGLRLSHLDFQTFV